MHPVERLKSDLPHAIVEEILFANETTLHIKTAHLKEVFLSLKTSYQVLMDLTGVDFLEPQVRTKIVYWLHNPSNLERLRITIYAARGETIPSVTDLWEGANWFEREIYDLFGVRFEGHPDMKRILMPDDWKGHPLQRDYPLTEVPVEFKHGVKPKVPSEIIPYVQADRRRT